MIGIWKGGRGGDAPCFGVHIMMVGVGGVLEGEECQAEKHIF